MLNETLNTKPAAYLGDMAFVAIAFLAAQMIVAVSGDAVIAKSREGMQQCY